MCGSFRRRHFATVDDSAYIRCRTCATVYADPRPGDELLVRRLDEFAADVPDDSPDALAAAVAAEQWKLELVAHYPVPGSRLLDIGTGSGAFVAAAAQGGYDAEGHDLGPAVAAAARTRFGITVHAGPVADLEGTWSVITLWDTLEHAADPPGLLRDCARLLEPGGYVIVLSPHAAGVTGRVRRARWWAFGPADHLVMLSMGALGGALATVGLRAVTLTTRQLSPPYPPEEADPTRTAMRVHRVFDTRPGVQHLLTRLNLGDWLLAAAGRPAPLTTAASGRPDWRR